MNKTSDTYGTLSDGLMLSVIGAQKREENETEAGKRKKK